MIVTDYRPRLFLSQNRRKQHKEERSFQNGTATDFRKKLKAMEKVKRANAELAKVVREEKEQLRKTQDRHKYMMGGCVVKYFPFPTFLY